MLPSNDDEGHGSGRTFREYLLGMNWEGAIHSLMESNDYYYNPSEHKNKTKTPQSGDDDDEEEKKKEKRRCVGDFFFSSRGGGAVRRALSRYLVSSSKTRLAIHGCMAAYVVFVASRSARVHPVTVAYDADKFKKHNSNGGVAAAGIRGFLQRLAFGSSSSSSLSSTTATATAASGGGVFVYQSREGTQLLLRSADLPRSPAMIAHTIAGCLLIPCALLQMETVPYMSHSIARRRAKAEADTREKENNSKQNITGSNPNNANGSNSADGGGVAAVNKTALGNVRNAREAHCTVGLVAVGSMVAMAAAGLAVRGHSVFAHTLNNNASGGGGTMDFGKLIVSFSIPWFLFGAALIGTAVNKKCFPHSMIGLVATKACLAVPLARVLGGVLQRILGVHIPIPSDAAVTATTATAPIAPVVHSSPGELERVYYISIATSTVIVGAWTLSEIARTLAYAHGKYLAEEEQRRRRSTD